MQAGAFFLVRGPCLAVLFFFSILFPCEGDRRVLAVLRPRVHLWNLAQVLVFHDKKFLHLCIVCE